MAGGARHGRHGGGVRGGAAPIAAPIAGRADAATAGQPDGDVARRDRTADEGVPRAGRGARAPRGAAPAPAPREGDADAAAADRARGGRSRARRRRPAPAAGGAPRRPRPPTTARIRSSSTPTASRGSVPNACDRPSASAGRLLFAVAVSCAVGGVAAAGRARTRRARRRLRPRRPPPPAADSADVSKAECLSRYEEAQVARRERRLLDSRAALRICSRAACPAAIRADCVDWLDQVAHSLPSVVVTARARGADILGVKVFVDGKLATEKLTGFALEIDPGLHKFRFESPPWPVMEREVLASEGVKDRPIEVEFAPPLPPSALSAHPERQAVPPGALGLRVRRHRGGRLRHPRLLRRHRPLRRAPAQDTSCAPFCDRDDVNTVRDEADRRGHRAGASAVVALAVGLYLHGKGAF